MGLSLSIKETGSGITSLIYNNQVLNSNVEGDLLTAIIKSVMRVTLLGRCSFLLYLIFCQDNVLKELINPIIILYLVLHV